jgi:hypothetical protein
VELFGVGIGYPDPLKVSAAVGQWAVRVMSTDDLSYCAVVSNCEVWTNHDWKDPIPAILTQLNILAQTLKSYKRETTHWRGSTVRSGPTKQAADITSFPIYLKGLNPSFLSFLL